MHERGPVKSNHVMGKVKVNDCQREGIVQFAKFLSANSHSSFPRMKI